jgi:hypothetical protein
MPVVNDASITDDTLLLRVLRPDWICLKNGRYRPESLAFTDGRSGEVSCFIASEGVEAEVRRMFPGHKIAAVPARVVRQSGFVIQRRPGECEGFNADPTAHVVIGCDVQVPKKQYERCARAIAVHAETTILPEPPTPESNANGEPIS